MSFLTNKRIVVMGLLSPHSLAWTIGQQATKDGAHVIYTVQSERLLNTLVRREFSRSEVNLDSCHILPCDVCVDDEIKTLFEQAGEIDGVVYSIAYASQKTCFTGILHNTPREDAMQALNASAVSLAYVAGEARSRMPHGGSIVALSFDSHRVVGIYDWMHAAKATLEAIVRVLASDLGKQDIRINCVSAGPVETKASTSIPKFSEITDVWDNLSPLPWDSDDGRASIAHEVVHLLSDRSMHTTGSVRFVDGGANIVMAKA